MRMRGGAVLGPIVLSLALLAVPTLFTGCSEDRNPVGFDSSGRRIETAPQETVFVAVEDHAFHSTPLTSASRSILVGSDEQAASIGLIRFNSIPDTTGLVRAYLRVHLRRGRGSAVDLSLRRIVGSSSSWSASEVTWENAPGADPDPLSTAIRVPTSTIEPDSTDSTVFEVPPSLLRLWKAQPDSNAGFQIASDRGSGTARIISHNDVLFGETYRIATPSLHLVYSGTDREETIVLASADAYVFEDKRPEPAEPDTTAWVTAGPASRFFLKFDLSSLVPHASIVRATLLLPVFSSDLLESDPMLLGAYAVTDTTGAIGANAVGLSNEQTDPFELEVGSLAQLWVNGEANHGVIVRAQDEVSTMEGIQFHTSDAVTDSTRPRLRVIYVPPPDPRWPAAK